MPEKKRFIVPRVFSQDGLQVNFGAPEDKDSRTVSVDGITGLAALGFNSFVTGLSQDGPKDLRYVTETAEMLAVFLPVAWKPGDSAEITRKRFQLSRALYHVTNNLIDSSNTAKDLKGAARKRHVTFRSRVEKVLSLPDEMRNYLYSHDQPNGVADVIAPWNAVKQASRSMDVSAEMTDLTS